MKEKVQVRAGREVHAAVWRPEAAALRGDGRTLDLLSVERISRWRSLMWGPDR